MFTWILLVGAMGFFNLGLAQNAFLSLSEKTDIYELVDQLAQIETNKPGHKFVMTEDRIIQISLSGQKKPNHKTLRGSKKAISAGYINFTEQKDGVLVYLDNRSGAICPSFESLNLVSQRVLELLPEARFQLVKNPNLEKCNN